MTFQVKIVPQTNVQVSGDASLTSMDVMAPDARDVEAFSGMMEQGSSAGSFGAGLAQTTGKNGVPYAEEAADLPSPATLLSSWALSEPTTVSPTTQASSTLLDDDVVMQTAGALGVQQSTVQPMGAQVMSSTQSTQDSDTPVYLNDSDPNAYTASLLASMNTLLQSSSIQNPVPMTVAETTTVTAPHFTAQEVDAMVTMLVQRITVTDTSAHMVTVEVSLADTALRGTTVQLTRSLDGLLAVNVMTNDAMSFQTLVGAQVDLRAKLEAMEVGTVRVDISHTTQEQERDPQRRSATYQAYSGDDDDQA